MCCNTYCNTCGTPASWRFVPAVTPFTHAVHALEHDVHCTNNNITPSVTRILHDGRKHAASCPAHRAYRCVHGEQVDTPATRELRAQGTHMAPSEPMSGWMVAGMAVQVAAVTLPQYSPWIQILSAMSAYSCVFHTSAARTNHSYMPGGSKPAEAWCRATGVSTVVSTRPGTLPEHLLQHLAPCLSTCCTWFP